MANPRKDREPPNLDNLRETLAAAIQDYRSATGKTRKIVGKVLSAVRLNPNFTPIMEFQKNLTEAVPSSEAAKRREWADLLVTCVKIEEQKHSKAKKSEDGPQFVESTIAVNKIALLSMQAMGVSNPRRLMEILRDVDKRPGLNFTQKFCSLPSNELNAITALSNPVKESLFGFLMQPPNASFTASELANLGTLRELIGTMHSMQGVTQGAFNTTMQALQQAWQTVKNNGANNSVAPIENCLEQLRSDASTRELAKALYSQVQSMKFVAATPEMPRRDQEHDTPTRSRTR